MSWTGLPATDATDWSAIAFARQFREALNERIAFSDSGVSPDAFPYGQATVPVVGSDLQWSGTNSEGDAVGSWALTQQRIEDLAPFYLVASHPLKTLGSSTPRDYANYTAFLVGEMANFYTIESMFLEAGLTADGWRRTTVHPSDPAFVDFEYGQMQPGDIIGPWIFNDLQATLGVLRIKLYPATMSGSEFEGESEQLDDYDDAYADFLDDWSAGSGSGDEDLQNRLVVQYGTFGGVTVIGQKQSASSVAFKTFGSIGTALTAGVEMHVHSYVRLGGSSAYHNFSELTDLAEDEVRSLGEPDLSSGSVDRSADVDDDTPPPQLPAEDTVGYRQAMVYLGVADLHEAGVFDYGDPGA